jgi:chromosomal replication initiator protein
VDNPGSGTPANEIWQQGAVALQSRLPEATWAMWFHRVRPLTLENDHLVLAVPNALALQRIEAQYRDTVREALRDAVGRELAVDLVIDTEVREPEPFTAAPPAPAPVGAPVAAPGAAPPDKSPKWAGAALIPRYTFDQFVIGASNRFAHAAALSVAEAPGRAYNPLFVYGAAGLGKTHLLHAVGHYVQAMFPDRRIRYVSTETLMNEFVDALRAKTMPTFKRRYREIDVLLLDDIQFLERTNELQEELFYTFNTLHNAGSQIVISSDRPPKSIAELEDRLRSRFEWGLITDVQPPEFETRLAILRKKAEAEHFERIPDEVLAFIATNITDNVRELEGALIRVDAYSRLHGAALNAEVAQEVLADLLPPSKPRTITPELILEETAKMFGWTVDDLCGKSRRRPLVTARQTGMYVFRELTDFSYPRIAEQFGGRDHSTVMYAVDKIKRQMAERHTTFEQVNLLIARIKHGSGG